MGLFGKKDKVPEGIRVQFYEGDLPGFVCNEGCQILLQPSAFRVTRTNPNVEVNLDRKRLCEVEVLYEDEYMAKYKGVTVNKPRRDMKVYLVIYYISKEGDKRHLDFWGTAFETIKLFDLRQEIIKCQSSSSYEI